MQKGKPSAVIGMCAMKSVTEKNETTPNSYYWTVSEALSVDEIQ